jgi:5-amino-6-(5-phosphoribosylamino)uracil reductase
VDVTQLLPDTGATTVEALLDDLRLNERAPGGRPYLVLNMVASIDGRTTLGGHVGDLTSPVDQRVVYRLRTQADALLVGAGTARNERYGALFPDGRQRLVVIVSGRVDLPADLPLLGEPDARVLIATPDPEAVLDFDSAAPVEYLRLPGEGGRVDCAALCSSLRSDYGVRSLVCEGGPSLNEALISYAVVDELFLSLSPMLVGGGERTLVDTAPAHGVQHARLVSVATADDYLFLRYAL